MTDTLDRQPGQKETTEPPVVETGENIPRTPETPDTLNADGRTQIETMENTTDTAVADAQAGSERGFTEIHFVPDPAMNSRVIDIKNASIAASAGFRAETRLAQGEITATTNVEKPLPPPTEIPAVTEARRFLDDNRHFMERFAPKPQDQQEILKAMDTMLKQNQSVRHQSEITSSKAFARLMKTGKEEARIAVIDIFRKQVASAFENVRPAPSEKPDPIRIADIAVAFNLTGRRVRDTIETGVKEKNGWKGFLYQGPQNKAREISAQATAEAAPYSRPLYEETGKHLLDAMNNMKGEEVRGLLNEKTNIETAFRECIDGLQRSGGNTELRQQIAAELERWVSECKTLTLSADEQAALQKLEERLNRSKLAA